ncbi:hypothetical protein Droror1_Dr00001817 [Drosera rotundifolia]
MALSISLIQTLTKSPIFQPLPKTLNLTHFSHSSPNLLCLNLRGLRCVVLNASKQQVKPPPSSKKKKTGGARGGGGGGGGRVSRVTKEVRYEEVGIEDGLGFEEEMMRPLPKPPAGFVLDDEGRVVKVSSKRLTTIVDPLNKLRLECVIRRVFTNSQGGTCMLLCPVDMPILIVKSTNYDGWTDLSDEETERVLPFADYALAKAQMHLVHSGFCYTARGGFCYSEDCIFELRPDEQDIAGMPSEGVELTCFHVDGTHYMIYTPCDPLLFVAVKDGNGELQIVEDELLDDPAVGRAIDEETVFNAMVEEEAVLLESLMGGTL